MLRSIRELKGYGIEAKDGRIGTVGDFYFDDREWAIRYLIVDLGGWLPGREVLISPAAATHEPDWKTASVPIGVASGKMSTGMGHAS